jgi:hypothetical protein
MRRIPPAMIEIKYAGKKPAVRKEELWVER